MADMTYNTIAFYGDRQEIQELDTFLAGSEGDQYFDFNKIQPIPDEFKEISGIEFRIFTFQYWGATWCEDVDRSLNNFDEFSTLKVSFNTPWNPPLKIMDYICEKFPGIKYVYRCTMENEWYETKVIRRDPSRGFRECLTDNPYGENGHPEELNQSVIDVVDDFISELNEDQQLSFASELIGITVDRINQRKEGTLKAI